MVFCVLFKPRNLALEREKEDFFLYKRCTKSLEKKNIRISTSLITLPALSPAYNFSLKFESIRKYTSINFFYLFTPSFFEFVLSILPLTRT